MSIIVLKPKMSEKTYALSNSRVYVFNVDSSLNKHQVAKTVEQTYEVVVTKVNMVNTKGKAKRAYKGRKFENGMRSDLKKAYVTLAEGNAIPIFAAVEEAEVKAEKSTEVAKKSAEKAAKKAKKDGK